MALRRSLTGNVPPGPVMSRSAWLLSGAVVLITALVYGQVAWFDFVYLDDHVYVTENETLLNGFTLTNIYWAFTTNVGGNWHPLTWFTYFLDYELYGLSPGGYHVTNLLFHLANSWLLFFFVMQVTRRQWASAAVAVLFALHPLHVESVAWVSERKDVLSTFFWLLAMIFYAHYARRPGWQRYLLVVLAVAAGLMAKPMVVTLPCVLLLLDIWPLQRLSLTDRNNRYSWRSLKGVSHWIWLEKVPLFLLALVTALVTLVTQTTVGAMHRSMPLDLRLKNAIVSYAAYLWDTLWPTGLQAYYMHPGNNLGWGLPLLSFAVLAAITAAVVWYGRQRPLLLTGWLWYIGTLVPVVGIIQVGGQARADRYTYVPLIGIFLILALELPRWLPKERRSAILAPIGAILLIIMSIVTWRQVHHWRHTIPLFEHAIRVNPQNTFAYNNLGAHFAKEADHERAITYYDRALAIDPHYIFSLHNKGLALLDLNRFEEARDILTRAFRIAPQDRDVPVTLGLVHMKLKNYAEAAQLFRGALATSLSNKPEIRNSLAVCLLELERYQEGLDQIEKALADRPGKVDFLENQGLLLVKLGRHKEALDAYLTALKQKPTDAKLLNRSGLAHYNLGQFEQSTSYLEQAVSRSPDLYDGWINLGTVRAVTGQHAAAEEAFRRAAELDPDASAPWFNLGKLMQDTNREDQAWPLYRKAVDMGYVSSSVRLLLALQAHTNGDLDQAIADYRAALEIDPSLILARSYLAAGLASHGQTAEAEQQFEEVLRRDPRNAEAHNNFGAMLVNQGRLAEAAEHFRTAVRLNPDYQQARQNLQKVESLLKEQQDED